MKKYLRGVFAILASTLIGSFLGCSGISESESSVKGETSGLNNVSRSIQSNDDYQKEIIYFLFVDRFFDGNSANNNGNNYAQYDSSRTDWKKYWGGDLAGMNQKLDYLKEMGINAVWVTPLVDGIDVLTADGDAPFHGYWGKNFFNIDEHWGTWSEFDSLISKMHSDDYNMKLILDYAPNHSSANDEGEFGALYKSSYDNNGNVTNTWKLTDYNQDINGNWYHRLGGVGDDEWDDPYKCRYKNLFNLSDFNQDNETTYSYLADGLEMWLGRGVDGVRLDAVKHMNTSFTTRLVADMNTRFNKEIYFFGEWMDAGAWATGLNTEGQYFENTSGCALLDFGYRSTIEKVLKNTATMRTLASYLSARETYWANPLKQVVFLDNHDMPRINTVLRGTAGMSESYASARTDLGLAITMTIRGVPCIYYGTEQYTANFTTNGFGQQGSDPYNREMMPSFNTNTRAYNIIKTLAELRQNNAALQNGTYAEKWQEDDIIAYERKSGNDVVVVVANKGSYKTISIPNISLSDGQYKNLLTPANKYNVTNGTVTISIGENEVIVLATETVPPVTKVAKPTFSTTGAVSEGTLVTISSATEGATIYYTTDGSEPSINSLSGVVGTSSASITINNAMVVKAFAVKNGLTDSDKATAEYTISAGLTIKIKNNDVINWTNINCYYWASDGQNISNQWPGQSMTVDNNNWYTFNIAGASTSNIIFNNGNSQTIDYSRTSDGWFVPTGWTNNKLVGTWYDSNPDSNINTNTSGKLTIVFISSGNAENVSFPGDANGWSLTSNTASVNANSTTSIVINNCITTASLALGNNTSKLELKLVSNSSWDNQWSFGSWTKSSNITLSDSNRQIAIDCNAGNDVVLTIDVGTLSITAEVISSN